MACRWRLLGLSLGLATALAGCRPLSGPSDSAAQSTPADGAAFAGTVMLSLLDDNKAVVGFCSGVFVRQGQILTVAHCFDGPKFSAIEVSAFAGALHNNSPVTTSLLANPAYDHSQPWSARLGKDLAVVSLPSGVDAGVPLPRFATTPPKIPGDATLVGYGASNPNDVSTAGVHYIKPVHLTGVDGGASSSFTSAPWPPQQASSAPAPVPPGATPPTPVNPQGGDAGCPLFDANLDLIGLSIGMVDLAGQEPPNLTATGAGSSIHYVSIMADDATAFLGKNLTGIAVAPTAAAASGTSTAASTDKYTDPASGEQHPYCTAAATADANSPGWGWENNQTCRIKN